MDSQRTIGEKTPTERNRKKSVVQFHFVSWKMKMRIEAAGLQRQSEARHHAAAPDTSHTRTAQTTESYTAHFQSAFCAYLSRANERKSELARAPIRRLHDYVATCERMRTAHAHTLTLTGDINEKSQHNHANKNANAIAYFGRPQRAK